LLRRADRASLGVVVADASGQATQPYVSLVLLAIDHDLAPILLLSALAEHSKAMVRHSRISLLVDGTAGLQQPLTGPRLTLLGRAEKSDQARLRARYLARHPDAARYVDFGDFSFYRVEVERAHLVAGFGRIEWLERDSLVMGSALADPLVDAETDIIFHMNGDHAAAVDLYANRLLRLPGGGWRLCGIDREGIDLGRDGAHARLDFSHPVTTADEARSTLVSLVRTARETP
jgi:putative heme iron utilization protein